MKLSWIPKNITKTKNPQVDWYEKMIQIKSGMNKGTLQLTAQK